jgi:hypothetical protein
MNVRVIRVLILNCDIPVVLDNMMVQGSTVEHTNNVV